MLRNFIRKLMYSRRDPIIFITGCTGTGKSDFGVAIAEKYNGEIISADSMQVYKSLDIVTNKITSEEAKGIPHHLMSFLDPIYDDYNVQEFQASALEIIKEIRNRGNIPIVVGGTAYYIESILFENNIIVTEKNDCFNDHSEISNAELHALLKEVDPLSAGLVHPNDRSRVLRALDIYKLTGRQKSEILQKQQELNGVQRKSRFQNTLVINMDANEEILDKRLNIRVDKMISAGLKTELESFYIEHEDTLNNITHGVLQCIGPKEFIPYLKFKELWRNPDGEKLFLECGKELQLHTRQYARKQRRWIRNRFFNRRLEDNISLITIDSSKPETFINDGVKIVDQWMSGEDFKGKEVNEYEKDINTVYECIDCKRVIAGEKSWKAHLNGKPHKKRVSANKRKSKIQDQIVEKM